MKTSSIDIRESDNSSSFKINGLVKNWDNNCQSSQGKNDSFRHSIIMESEGEQSPTQAIQNVAHLNPKETDNRLSTQEAVQYPQQSQQPMKTSFCSAIYYNPQQKLQKSGSNLGLTQENHIQKKQMSKTSNKIKSTAYLNKQFNLDLLIDSCSKHISRTKNKSDVLNHLKSVVDRQSSAKRQSFTRGTTSPNIQQKVKHLSPRHETKSKIQVSKTSLKYQSCKSPVKYKITPVKQKPTKALDRNPQSRRSSVQSVIEEPQLTQVPSNQCLLIDDVQTPDLNKDLDTISVRVKDILLEYQNKVKQLESEVKDLKNENKILKNRLCQQANGKKQ